jgi:hypothetical protein
VCANNALGPKNEATLDAAWRYRNRTGWCRVQVLRSSKILQQMLQKSITKACIAAARVVGIGLHWGSVEGAGATGEMDQESWWWVRVVVYDSSSSERAEKDVGRQREKEMTENKLHVTPYGRRGWWSKQCDVRIY